MNYKGIIFDLDGTLLDTIADIGDSCNKALEQHGFPTFSYDDYKIKVGGGFNKLVERCLPADVDEVIFNQVLVDLLAIYEKVQGTKTAAYDGIIDLLHTLNEQKIPVAINTNKKQAYLPHILETYFKDITFVDVRGDIEGTPTKPAPDNAKIIIEQMGAQSNEILFVGDTNVDMQTGTNAGCATIGVSWGFRDVSELRANGANYIIDEPQSILNFFK